MLKFLLHYSQYIWKYHQRVDFVIGIKSLLRNYYFNHETIFYDPFRFSNQAILLSFPVNSFSSLLNNSFNPPSLLSFSITARSRAAFIGFKTTPIPSFPSSTPACTAQPKATASSGSTVLCGTTPVSEDIIRPIVGIRVAPPTKTIRDIGRPDIPSARTLVSGSLSCTLRDSSRYFFSRLATCRAFFRPFCCFFFADRRFTTILSSLLLVLSLLLCCCVILLSSS
mmetsp:Transcript_13179/g.14124  ORF Transcript_13179/g.14124 Transcript_13179/m.14124 type:complete len:225 (-) Transcript_13179:1563-2237(-)